MIGNVYGFPMSAPLIDPNGPRWNIPERLPGALQDQSSLTNFSGGPLSQLAYELAGKPKRPPFAGSMLPYTDYPDEGGGGGGANALSLLQDANKARNLYDKASNLIGGAQPVSNIGSGAAAALGSSPAGAIPLFGAGAMDLGSVGAGTLFGTSGSAAAGAGAGSLGGGTLASVTGSAFPSTLEGLGSAGTGTAAAEAGGAAGGSAGAGASGALGTALNTVAWAAPAYILAQGLLSDASAFGMPESEVRVTNLQRLADQLGQWKSAGKDAQGNDLVQLPNGSYVTYQEATQLGSLLPSAETGETGKHRQGTMDEFNAYYDELTKRSGPEPFTDTAALAASQSLLSKYTPEQIDLMQRAQSGDREAQAILMRMNTGK